MVFTSCHLGGVVAVDTYVTAAQAPPREPHAGLAGELGAVALPPGFPFLVDADSGEVIEPALLFLTRRHLSGVSGRGRSRWVRNTALAHAHDLNDWWKFLGAASLDWDTVGRADIQAYHTAMTAAISPSTHEPLSESSMRRRVGTVLAFYNWARGEGLFVIEFQDQLSSPRRYRIDSDPLAHTRSGLMSEAGSDLLPRGSDDHDEHVRPLTARHAMAVLNELGPDTLEQMPTVPARSRLAAELALNTGMRVGEVASLRAHQILALSSPESDSARAVVGLRLTLTKGLVPRTVYLPIWLLDSLMAYIKGERAEALREAAERGLNAGAQGLFVNGISAGVYVGRDVRRETLQHEFRSAVVKCGLTSRALKTNPENGEQYIRLMPRHSYHDLRHTFAVWTYLARRQGGDSEPWKYVQARLGHKNLATTLAIYLRVVGELEQTASDHMASYYRSLASTVD